MGQSAVEAFRDGSWREISASALAILAAIAVLADVLTTAHILYSPSYWEGNRMLARLADIDPAVALAVFAGYCSLYLAVTWLSFGWLSTATGAFLVISMGIGGINNLLLFSTGTAFYPRIGVSHTMAIHVIKPALGFALGLAIASRRGPLPWREVGVVVAIGAVSTVVELSL